MATSGESDSVSMAKVDSTPQQPEVRSLATEMYWRQITAELLNGLMPHQRAVLSLIAMQELHAVGASASLASLGCELPGRAGDDAIKLANQLEEGKDPLRTLESYPRLVPPESLILMRLAREEGRLNEVFELIQDRRPHPDPIRRSRFGSNIGLFLKLNFVLVVISFFLIKIAPEILKILSEFGVNNWQTDLRGRVVQIAQTILVIAGVISLLTALIWASVRTFNFFFGRSGLKSVAASKPALRRRFLGSLALVTRSLGHDLMKLSHVSGVKRLLPRMSSVERDIYSGKAPWQALAQQKLISRSDADLISSARAETQAWILRWQATRIERFGELRKVFAGRMFFSLVQLVLILIVLLACWFVFGSLFELMQQLAKW